MEENSQTASFTFINVGYGESILIRVPDRKNGLYTILIDGGSALSSEYEGDSGRIPAIHFLKEHGISHIDALFFSHVHEDHTCGLVPILKEIPVDACYSPIRLAETHYGKVFSIPEEWPTAEKLALTSFCCYAQILQELPPEKIRFLSGVRPGFLKFGDLTMDLLGPDPLYRQTTEAALDEVFRAADDEARFAAVRKATELMNNASLILRCHYHGKRVLLVGDTNREGFGHILNSCPELLRAEIQKIGHHGQADALSPELIRAVQADTFVCCASNDFRNHSSSETTFRMIDETLPGKSANILFQDAVFLPPWAADAHPRSCVTLRMDSDSICG